MKRLTEHSKQTSHENGICCTHFRGPECLGIGGNCAMNCKWEEAAWSRLAAYEDTGLTPKEAKRMSNILMDVGIDYNCSWEYVKNWLLDARLRELAEADKEGRIVVLPCKVGDTVYKVITIQAQKPVMLETQIKTLGQAADVSQLIGKKNKVINIFLTREEAEAALKKMEGKNDEL